MLYFARWKVILVLAVVALGAVFAVPNLASQSDRFTTAPNPDGPGFIDVPRGVWNYLPNRSVNLGLDLQGGAYLLLEVDMAEVQEERLNAALDDAQTLLRSDAVNIPASGYAVVDDYVTLNVDNVLQKQAALDALQALSEPIQAAVGFANARTLTIEEGPDREIRISISREYLQDIRQRTVRDSIEVIRRRIDFSGVSEPTIQRQGNDRIVVQAPGVDDPDRLEQQIGRTARMTFHMVRSDAPADIQAAARRPINPVTTLLPEEFPFIYPSDHPEAGQPAPSDDRQYWEQCLQRPCILVEKEPELTGDQLRAASQGFHPDTGEPIVNFTFNQAGAVQFCQLTSANVGNRFATVLDGVVITAPNINSPICGGSGFIEGSFTVESASDLSALLSAGALPARLTVEERRTVGAQLGADSVRAGAIALIIGFIAVVIFMLAAYGVFGIFANFALAANVILIAGALSGLGATLTLPGIAGIILTIGMAVDANVLIFERIREEARQGRTMANAIEAGYARAFSAIRDANITTLFAAVILYTLGSGPVRGFAVTLAIGIVTSVFTAFVFSRLLVATWLRVTKPRALPI